MYRRTLLLAVLILAPIAYAQEGVLRSKDALVLENIPPRPNALT